MKKSIFSFIKKSFFFSFGKKVAWKKMNFQKCDKFCLFYVHIVDLTLNAYMYYLL